MNIFQASAGKGASVLVVLYLLLLSWPAAATHERDHRYEVRGYVLDDQRQPRAGVTVSVSKDNRSIGQSITDSRGHFSIQSHLHDADIGRVLLLRAGSAQGEIRMQATRGDTSTHRVHHVNFIGAGLVEQELNAGGVPPWIYAAGGAIAVFTVAGLALRGRRKKPKVASAEQQKPESKKRKKRNKNKKKKR